MIKLIWNKFKEKFTLIDDAFGWFQNTKIGKFYLKGTSFNKIFFVFGTILIAQISVYNNVMHWADKVNMQLENSEGLIYLGWVLVSWIVSYEGNIFSIVILILLILGAWLIRNKELDNALKNPDNFLVEFISTSCVA